MADVTGDKLHWYSDALTISGDFLHRYSGSLVEGDFVHLWSNYQEVTGDKVHVWDTWPLSVFQALGQDQSFSESYDPGFRAYNARAEAVRAGTKLIITNRGTGARKTIDLFEYAANLEINREVNGISSFSLTFQDNMYRAFAVDNTESEFYGWITLACFETPWNPLLTWRFQINVNGAAWNSPVFVPVQITRNEGAGGVTTTITGMDLMRNLVQENQSLESVETTEETGVQYARDIITETLREYGITRYDVSKFEDFPIRKFHRQGMAPIDMLNSLMEIPVAYWFFEGDVFHVKQPYQMGGQAVSWRYRDTLNIFELSHNWDVGSLINEIDVIRTSEVAGEEIFENEGAGACGLQVVSLATPRMTIHLRIIDSRWGSLGHVLPMDANDNYQGYGGVRPWVKVQFVFQQEERIQDLASGMARWKIGISGHTVIDHTFGGLFDETFNVKIKNSISQNRYGLWPASQPINNPLIPDEAWAIRHGRRKLSESIRRTYRTNFRVPLNPWLRPTDVILVQDYLSVTNNQRFFVENVKHDLRNFSTSFEATKWVEESI